MRPMHATPISLTLCMHQGAPVSVPPNPTTNPTKQPPSIGAPMRQRRFNAAKNPLKPITRKTLPYGVWLEASMEDDWFTLPAVAAHAELCCVLLTLDERATG